MNLMLQNEFSAAMSMNAFHVEVHFFILDVFSESRI